MQTEDGPSLIYQQPFYFHHTSDKQEDYPTGHPHNLFFQRREKIPFYL
jgi:hypothetical protein